jgi:hypothetical protein
MRFFLNLSCFLIIFVTLLLCVPRPLVFEGLMLAFVPVLIALLFFVAFLRLLKDLENKAAEDKDIELTTRVLGEFNKSWVIRQIIGEIPTFNIKKRA